MEEEIRNSPGSIPIQMGGITKDARSTWLELAPE